MKKFLGAGCIYFFDNEVSLMTERKMVDALNNEGVEHPLKRINLDPDLIDFVVPWVFHQSSWRIMLKFGKKMRFINEVEKLFVL
jgi:hypothetical protein